MLTFLAWAGAAQADALAPLDDVMGELIKVNGEVPEGITTVAKQNGHWIAVPAPVGSPTLPPCARIDYFKQYVALDLTKMYPAGAPPDKELTDKWTWENFLVAAEKCQKGGHAFGMPIGVTNDAVAWCYAVLRAHGAQMTDKDGKITVKSDATRQVLEWFKKLVPFLPDGVFAWDDSSNNKALISGQAALIMNPPSAWAVAVRDARPVAEQLWTFPTPKGPKGRFDPPVPFLWDGLGREQTRRVQPRVERIGLRGRLSEGGPCVATRGRSFGGHGSFFAPKRAGFMLTAQPPGSARRRCAARATITTIGREETYG